MGVELVDHYQILAIDRDADTAAIRSAWRRLAREHHPDVAKGKEAARRFVQIREAYEVLSDTKRRHRYDEWLERLGRARPRARPAPAAPRPPSPAPAVRAGALQRGVRLNVLGIIQIGAGFAGPRRNVPDPHARHGHT
jgi:curved DNA-binding protein CbpA